MSSITDQARQRAAARQARLASTRRRAENIQDLPEKGSESETGDASVTEDTSVDGVGGGIVGDDGSVNPTDDVQTPAAPDMSNDSLSPESPTAEEVDVEKEVNSAGDETQDASDQTVIPDTGEFTNESFPQNVARRKTASEDEDEDEDEDDIPDFIEEKIEGEDEEKTARRNAAKLGSIRAKIEDRIWASLRLADLRAQAGLSRGSDLISEASAISRDKGLSMVAIRVETSTLSALASRPQAPQRTASRRAPLTRAASMPSLASTNPNPVRGAESVDDSWLG